MDRLLAFDGPSFAAGCLAAALLWLLSTGTESNFFPLRAKGIIRQAADSGKRKRDVETGPPTPPKASPALPVELPQPSAPKISDEPTTSRPPTQLAPEPNKPAPAQAAPPSLKFTETEQVYDLRRGWITPEAPPKPVGASDDLFIAYNRSFNAKGAEETFVWLELKRPILLETVKRFFPATATLYETKPGIDARDVYVKMPLIRQQWPELSEEEAACMTILLDLVKSKFTQTEEHMKALPKGLISWRLLWTVFEAGQEIEASQESSSEPMGMVLDSWSYGSDSAGRAFILKCHHYQWTGVSFQRVNTTRKVTEYDELMAVADLPARPLTSKRKAQLATRGRRYVDFTSTQCHADYTGPFISRAFAGVVKLPGRGQVMVDVKGFRRINPTLDVWNDDAHQSSDSKTATPVSALEEEYWHLLPPTLHGFSFPNKKWGELLVDHLHHINWDAKHSFDHLVIPDSYRNVIRALVDVHSGKMKDELIADVVEGKGAGLIITLHGRPGTGKTLTAEAVADHLKRPLYAVSAGELGMNPTNLERQLKDILELATSWRSVLLIDEADVFLEKRNSTQLDRNALVGVFLRLLEYFQGVLILTTNHIDHFDEAFASRFTISLAFEDLNEQSRRTLWERFLAMVYPKKSTAELGDIFDLDELAKIELNGRVIRRVIRTAQALSLFEKKDMTMDHLQTVLAFDRN